MAYLSQYEYYENNGVTPQNANWGSYQYISLEDIVTNYLLMYYGNHSLVKPFPMIAERDYDLLLKLIK